MKSRRTTILDNGQPMRPLLHYILEQSRRPEVWRGKMKHCFTLRDDGSHERCRGMTVHHDEHRDDVGGVYSTGIPGSLSIGIKHANVGAL